MGRRFRAATYTRAMIGLVMATALLLPRLSSPLGPGIAHAAAPQVVWKLGKGTFDPTTKFDEIDSTFTPTGSTYVVEVALVSSDPGDEAYAQLGTNNADATQVTAGEDRFFAASNLVKGQKPRFVMIADPKHDYGGRTLTFAAAVYAVPDLPLDVSGTAASAVPNILGFNAPSTGSYTVHYSFDTGSARIVFLDSGGHQQESGKLAGEGGYSLNLPSGLIGIGIKQTPDVGVAQNWHITVGQSIVVGKLTPANNASLKTSPKALTAAAPKGAQLVLDHKAVGGVYDPSTGVVTYTPTKPLAAGQHELQVAGADGTIAKTSSQFVVLPNVSITPATTPAGTINGAPWVNTTTPDGLYHFKMPASWRLLASGTHVVLLDPKNSGVVILDERFLGQTIDATAVAKQISAGFKGTLNVQGTWSYLGGKDKAAFTGLVIQKGKKTTLASVNLVFPSPSSYSLLLAYGYGNATTSAVTNLGDIEGSIGINSVAQIQSSRTYQHYSRDGLKVDYPVGWAANFVQNNGTWFAGPEDGAIMVAVGLTYSGTGANDTEAKAFAAQVQDLEKTTHPKIVLLSQSTTNGVDRWIGAYPSDDGKSIVIEIGQSLVGNGHLVGMWGDTSLDQAPSNLAILQHTMDSAVTGVGLTAPTPLTIDSMIQAVRQAGGSTAGATTSNGRSSTSGSASSGSVSTGSSTADYLKSYQQMANQNFYYQTMSNVMEMQYQTNQVIINNMSDTPYDYEYTYNYDSY